MIHVKMRGINIMILMVILTILLSLSVLVNISTIIIIKKKLKIIDIYQDWVLTTISKLQNTYIRLKEIDDKQMFEKDDDVGVAFKNILDAVDSLNKEIE